MDYRIYRFSWNSSCDKNNRPALDRWKILYTGDPAPDLAYVTHGHFAPQRCADCTWPALKALDELGPEWELMKSGQPNVVSIKSYMVGGA